MDNKRGDIVELNDDLNKMKYVSRHGEAPYETVMPFTFSLLNDTVYVVDFGTRSIMGKFFFKQKTAYEISVDWSSDVCSSDLTVIVLKRVVTLLSQTIWDRPRHIQFSQNYS